MAPIFNDNYSAARFTNCFINANAAQEVFISTGFPSLINCTVTNYRSRAYSCYAAGNAVILGSVFSPLQGFQNAKIARLENHPDAL